VTPWVDGVRIVAEAAACVDSERLGVGRVREAAVDGTMTTALMRAVPWVAAFAGLVVLAAYWWQGLLVYAPDTTRVNPAMVGLGEVDERWLDVAAGVKVVTWYARARPGRPTLLYFHGNGGNLAARADRIRFFLDRGIGVYMMSYRGYSGSGGVPSETANIADARRAWRDLLGLGAKPGSVFLYGESLGSGVASQIAVDTPAAGLILDAPFTSIVDIGAAIYPWLPVRWLLVHRYETIAVIGNVRMPLLVIHGDADEVIPVAMGRAVFAAASKAEPKRFVVIPGAGHSDHGSFGSMEVVAEFVDEMGRRLPP
jgi:pimeloyl-ACP methyl ester carboxylesterase